jgi:hypothetical protein
MWQNPILIAIVGVFLFITSYQAYVMYHIRQGQKRWDRLLDDMEPVMKKLNVQIVTAHIPSDIQDTDMTKLPKEKEG